MPLADPTTAPDCTLMRPGQPCANWGGIAMVVLMCFGLVACDDPVTAKRALENMGMTDITTDGFAFFMCGDKDYFSTKFAARNPQGRVVTGAVCSSWTKGATVRFD